MVKKLISRSEFAQRAGVSAAAITKACATALAPACDGKRIDAAHPAAVAYLQSKGAAKPPSPAPGIDGLYAEAVAHCQASGRWSVSGLQREFKIGYNRAAKIVQTMRANGVIPAGCDTGASSRAATPATRDVTAAPPAGVDKPPHVRGTAAAKQKRKAESLAKIDLSADTPLPAAGPELPQHLEELADWSLRDIVARWGTDIAFIDWLKALKEIEVVAEKRIKNAQSRGELVSRRVVKEGVIDTIDGAFTRMLTDGAKTMATRVSALIQTGAKDREVEDFIAKQLSTFIKPTKSKITRVLRNA